MDLRINGQFGRLSGFAGPSRSYYDAQERFEEILTTKLGVSKELPAPSSVSGEEGRSSDFALSAYRAGTLADIRNRKETERPGLRTAVIDSSNLRRKSSISTAQLEEALQGTALAGLGAAFKKAEEDYGVNAVFLAGLAIHESDFGQSRIAREKNNLFGFKAYDRSPYKSAQHFSSFASGIDTVARYLSENYLTAGGKYYSGMGIGDIGKRYATDPDWSKGVEKRIRRLLGF